MKRDICVGREPLQEASQPDTKILVEASKDGRQVPLSLHAINERNTLSKPLTTSWTQTTLGEASWHKTSNSNLSFLQQALRSM